MRVGVSPIAWHNEDIADLTPAISAETLADEIRDAGFAATEFSSLFPGDPTDLRALLEPRGLQLISAYVGLRLPDCPLEAEVNRAKVAARFVCDAGGDVLVVALDYDERRTAIAGSVGVADVRFAEADWGVLVEALHRIGGYCNELGLKQVFHNEAGTFVETGEEFAELARRTDPALVALCLDVGHLTVGGGDAVSFFREHHARIKHVHVKDASREVIEGMRRREFGMMEALRRRVFCELGTGALDVKGLVGLLSSTDYDGWVVLEQDSTFRPPLESAKHNRETFRRMSGV